MKFFSLVEAQNLHVVLQIVLDAVVDVGDLADVINVGVEPEVFDQFAPATLHQLPRFTVVQNHVYNT